MDAHALLVVEAARIEETDPDKAALMLVEAVFPCFITVRMGLALETAQRAYDLSQAGAGSARLAATVRLAEALGFTGDDKRARQLLRECEEELAHADPLAAAPLLGTYAYFLMMLEEYAASRALLARLDAALRRSAPGGLPYPLGVLSELEFRTGYWRQAEAHAFEGARLANETGQANMLAYTLACRARIEAATGREREFKQHIDEALELAERFQRVTRLLRWLELCAPAPSDRPLRAGAPSTKADSGARRGARRHRRRHPAVASGACRMLRAHRPARGSAATARQA
jgi:hypothetical protein